MPPLEVSKTRWRAFLQAELPGLGFRWRGFRRVYKQVSKRLRRRLAELELRDLDAYAARLRQDPAERVWLDGACQIHISRFLRDAPVFHALSERLLQRPGGAPLRCWSAGCASGEEPYTLSLLHHLQARTRPLCVLATDAHAAQLERAGAGIYNRGSLKELPPDWWQRGFTREGERYRLRDRFRRDVRFEQQDLRRDTPEGPFDLILCRNLAFTYFDTALQQHVLRRLRERLLPGGWLVIGRKEQLPADAAFVAQPWARGVFQLRDGSS